MIKVVFFFNLNIYNHFQSTYFSLWPFHSSPHSPVKAVGTEAMSTLGLERPSEDIVAAVAQVFVLQLVAQDLLGEAGLIALHGWRRGRFLCGHGVCSHVTPRKQAKCQAWEVQQFHFQSPFGLSLFFLSHPKGNQYSTSLKPSFNIHMAIKSPGLHFLVGI